MQTVEQQETESAKSVIHRPITIRQTEQRLADRATMTELIAEPVITMQLAIRNQ